MMERLRRSEGWCILAVGMGVGEGVLVTVVVRCWCFVQGGREVVYGWSVDCESFAVAAAPTREVSGGS